MLQPHQGTATHERCQIVAKIWEMLLVSPSSWKTLTVQAVPGTAGTTLARIGFGVTASRHLQPPT